MFHVEHLVLQLLCVLHMVIEALEITMYTVTGDLRSAVSHKGRLQLLTKCKQHNLSFLDRFT